MNDTPGFQARRGREGNRWFNVRPDAAEVAELEAGAVVEPEPEELTEVEENSGEEDTKVEELEDTD